MFIRSLVDDRNAEEDISFPNQTMSHLLSCYLWFHLKYFVNSLKTMISKNSAHQRLFRFIKGT